MSECVSTATSAGRDPPRGAQQAATRPEEHMSTSWAVLHSIVPGLPPELDPPFRRWWPAAFSAVFFMRTCCCCDGVVVMAVVVVATFSAVFFMRTCCCCDGVVVVATRRAL